VATDRYYSITSSFNEAPAKKEKKENFLKMTAMMMMELGKLMMKK
jgi:hypothetical protein